MTTLIQKQAIILPNHNGRVCCIRYSILGLMKHICVNVIYSDIDGYHNHPWNFTSIILKGSYKETLWKDGEISSIIHSTGSVINRKHTEYHRVDPLTNKVVTLFIKGSKRNSYISWIKNNKIIHESKFWIMQGFSKEELRKVYKRMNKYDVPTNLK